MVFCLNVYITFFPVLPCDEGSGQGAGGAHAGDEIPDQQVHQAERQFAAIQ